MTRIRLTPNLLRLERGPEELLLADTRRFFPLYIPRGRAYVDRVLKAAAELGQREALVQAFPDDTPLIELLEKHGLIIPADTDPAAFRIDPAEAKARKAGRRRITLYLVLTQGCNLGCVYCLNGMETYHKASPRRMTEVEALAAIRRALALLSPGGELEIALFGGEPLLNWSLARRTIERTTQEIGPEHPDKKIHFHVTSNLTHLPAGLIHLARKHDLTFLCDVDGPPDLHDALRPYKGGRSSHADTVASIQRLSEAGLRVSLRATITRQSQDRLPEIVQHHRDLGGVSTALVPVSPVDSDVRLFPPELLPDPDRLRAGLLEAYGLGLWPGAQFFPFSTYAEKIRPGASLVMGCGAPYGNTPVVDADGAVYPCLYLLGQPEYRLGQAIQGPLLDDLVLDAMIDRLHVDVREDCRDCVWRYLCGGGCPVWRLLVLENPAASAEVKDYCRRINCDFTRTVLETLVWEMAVEAAQLTVGVEPEISGAAREAIIYC